MLPHATFRLPMNCCVGCVGCVWGARGEKGGAEGRIVACKFAIPKHVPLYTLNVPKCTKSTLKKGW